jgi:hypothetical protein
MNCFGNSYRAYLTLFDCARGSRPRPADLSDPRSAPSSEGDPIQHTPSPEERLALGQRVRRGLNCLLAVLHRITTIAIEASGGRPFFKRARPGDLLTRNREEGSQADPLGSPREALVRSPKRSQGGWPRAPPPDALRAIPMSLSSGAPLKTLRTRLSSGALAPYSY